ncbi:unnamed protein product [Staurois parvus]|uniref:Cytochrome c biogenesis B n=1 Tax=Staurois parvus TaxID=386267 RepID=A0ABN9AZY6_9NEOB|nr:unnamed protein product [Staurois parvus]
MSTISDHLLYHVHYLWLSLLSCPQSLTISCIMPTISGYLETMFYPTRSSLSILPAIALIGLLCQGVRRSS